MFLFVFPPFFSIPQLAGWQACRRVGVVWFTYWRLLNQNRFVRLPGRAAEFDLVAVPFASIRSGFASSLGFPWVFPGTPALHFASKNGPANGDLCTEKNKKKISMRKSTILKEIWARGDQRKVLSLLILYFKYKNTYLYLHNYFIKYISQYWSPKTIKQSGIRGIYKLNIGQL